MTHATLIAPADWAPYFINGDASGLSAQEIIAADVWLGRENVARVLTDRGEPFFSWSLRLHAPEAGYSGGMVSEYVCEVMS